jgi:hypothetical protein
MGMGGSMPGTSRKATPPRARRVVPAARRIRLSSLLPSSFREELERIVFFNPEQQAVMARLVEAVHRFGVPAIVEEQDHLRFQVPALGMLQTLYALDETDGEPRLAGVAMFTRDGLATIVVLHVALHEDYTVHGRWAAAAVVGRLLAAIRGAALRTHGIRMLRVPYARENAIDLRH